MMEGGKVGRLVKKDGGKAKPTHLYTAEKLPVIKSTGEKCYCCTGIVSAIYASVFI